MERLAFRGEPSAPRRERLTPELGPLPPGNEIKDPKDKRDLKDCKDKTMSLVSLQSFLSFGSFLSLP